MAGLKSQKDYSSRNSQTNSYKDEQEKGEMKKDIPAVFVAALELRS